MTLNLWALLFGAGADSAGAEAGPHPLSIDMVAIAKTIAFEGPMAREIEFVEGDTAGALVRTLSNGNGVADLTGATITTLLRNKRTGTLITVASSELGADPTTGEVTTPGSARSSWPAGDYEFRDRVAYADGSVDIFPSGRPNLVHIQEAWT